MKLPPIFVEDPSFILLFGTKALLPTSSDFEANLLFFLN